MTGPQASPPASVQSTLMAVIDGKPYAGRTGVARGMRAFQSEFLWRKDLLYPLPKQFCDLKCKG